MGWCLWRIYCLFWRITGIIFFIRIAFIYQAIPLFLFFRTHFFGEFIPFFGELKSRFTFIIIAPFLLTWQ
jgi:hypothetical protein